MKPLPPDTRPRIRSAWPTPIGKPLTNHKITKYIKAGYYATNNPTTRAARSPESHGSVLRTSKLLSKFI